MNIKKVAARLAAFTLAMPVLAQESVTIDVSAAEGAVDAIGTAVSGLLTGKVMENVMIVMGAGIAIAMLFIGVRWMLRGGKTSAK